MPQPSVPIQTPAPQHSLVPVAEPNPGSGGPSRRESRWASFFRSRGLGVAFVALILVLWETATVSGVLTSPNIPPISQILRVWGDAFVSGSLTADTAATLERMAIGFGIAGVLGVALGVLMGRVRFFYALLEPVTELIRPVPVAALIPLIILFFGIGDQMKVAAICLGAFFPVLLNSYAGTSSVPAAMRETAQTFGLSWVQTTRKVILPAAAPQIFVGLRISLAISLIVAVIAEMVAGNGGLGYYILNAQQTFDITGMYAGILTLALIGYVLNFGFLLIEGRLLHWHFASTRTKSRR